MKFSSMAAAGKEINHPVVYRVGKREQANLLKKGSVLKRVKSLAEIESHEVYIWANL